ncbi:MAG: DNA-binding response regulator [Spirochaetes bacterium GWB1_48_6]|nr:MAG: DNA-binding response regulator [Spirochaetes bacterium GWB1_48_6]
MKTYKVLVVEDDPDIRELISFNLVREGFEIHPASTGDKGLALALALEPDVILLDVMLPGIDGFEVCRRLKGKPETKHIPIIMITARSEDADIIAGLEIGADDYITKPFSPKVLSARIRTILRRQSGEGDENSGPLIKIRELILDPTRHAATYEKKTLDLSATEFAILKHLASHPGWVFSRSQIIDAVRGDNYPVTERSVDVQILSLRKKLGEAGSWIETVRGVGYKIKDSQE